MNNIDGSGAQGPSTPPGTKPLMLKVEDDLTQAFNLTAERPRDYARLTDDRHPVPIDNVLSRLKGFRPTSRGYTAHCPCPTHGGRNPRKNRQGDRKPSFTVRVRNDGSVALRCFGGCTFEEILAAIQLTPRDLYPPGSRPGRRGSRPAAGLAVSDLEAAAVSNPLQCDWMFAAMAAHERASANGALARLARTLSVTTNSLARLWVGQSICGVASTWPEQGANYNFLNLMCRHKGKEKFTQVDQARGVYAPWGWRRQAAATGHLLITEGGSDTAAALSMGLVAIGKPSADSGDHIIRNLVAKSLRDGDLPSSLTLVIVAHNDGKDGAGQRGSVVTEQWMSRLGVRVVRSDCPDGIKDIRDWLNARCPVPDDVPVAERRAIGREFLDKVMRAAPQSDALNTGSDGQVEATETPASPADLDDDTEDEGPGSAGNDASDPDGGSPKPQPLGPSPSPPATSPCDAPDAATRKQFDAEVAEAAAALHAPGRHVANGLAFRDERRAAAEVIAAARPRRSLVVVPDHADAATVAASITATGLDAAAYPRINQETCPRWESETRTAAEAGVPVGAVFCPSCPHAKGNDRCPYTLQKSRAEGAAHLVVTASRASLNPAGRAGTREAVLLANVHPIDVMRPSRSAKVGTAGDRSHDAGWCSESLRLLNEAASRLNSMFAGSVGEEPGDADPGSREALVAFRQVWLSAMRLTREADEALRAGEPRAIALPGQTERRGGYSWAEWLWKVLREWDHRPDGDVVRLVMRAASGGFAFLGVDPKEGLAGVSPLQRFPEEAAVLDLGSRDPASLSLATDEKWVAVRVDGAARFDNVAQLVRHVHGRTSARQLAGVVRLHLRRNSDRLGVVGHKQLLRRLKSELKRDGLPAEDFARLALRPWFGGPGGLETCDAVFCLGGPRPHRHAVFRRLLQYGDAAAYQVEGWGHEATWEGTTADGGRITIRGKGYSNERWQAVDAEISFHVMRRLLGPLTCPVVVVSHDRLDLTLSAERFEGVSAAGDAVFRAFRSAMTEAERASEPCADAAQSQPAVTTGELCAATGKGKRTVQEHLKAFRKLGWVGSAGKRNGSTIVSNPREDELTALPPEQRITFEALEAGLASAALSSDVDFKTLTTANAGENNSQNTYVRKPIESAPESAVPAPAIAKLAGLDLQMTRRELTRLQEAGLVVRIGSGKATRWTTVERMHPQAVSDPATARVFDEVHGRRERGEPALLPFQAAELAKLLGTPELTEPAFRLVPSSVSA